MKGCKTIAEYAIRQWMEQHGFVEGNFTVTMDGNDATIADWSGDSLAVRYDPVSRTVAEVEDRDLEAEERA